MLVISPFTSERESYHRLLHFRTFTYYPSAFTSTAHRIPCNARTMFIRSPGKDTDTFSNAFPYHMTLAPPMEVGAYPQDES